MISAGLITVDTSANFSSIPGHAGGKGFISRFTITIRENGYIFKETGLTDFYVYHGIVVGICWGIFGFV